ncbi:MAG: hypothetical protein II552_05075 [Bacteroidales bacterium]|jgi:hypothetical protein|nr:hypothetical protein [Bacteroidales bacterium]MBQ4305603.1 hypothetical protein [Bacteroidales bacterium]MBQ5943659.1 hypothetical protein [Bacteroidales bacterium]
MMDYSKSFENLSSDAREYIDLKVDDLKLRTVKGLSVTIGRLLWIILLLSVVSVVLMTLAFGLVALLGDVLDSFAAAAFIVAGIFVVLGVVVWFLKGKLFTDSLVRLFAKLFFDDNSSNG